MEEKYITFFSNRKKVILNTGTILYALTEHNKTTIHTTGGELYKTRLALGEMEKALGSDFIKIKRNCLVFGSAVESVGESVHLKNGDTLEYPARQKKRIIEELKGHCG